MRESEQQLTEWLSNVKFKKTLFGGVDELDVWKKIEELHSLYEKSLSEQRIYYETLLEEEKRHIKELQRKKTMARKKVSHD